MEEKSKSKFGLGQIIGWQTRGISLACNFLILGYLQIYCTNILGLSPADISTGFKCVWVVCTYITLLYTLDKKMPEIREELKKRSEANA